MDTNNIASYKDLIVWQKAVDLSVLMYRLSERFPKAEGYGITAQLRRAAVSIPSNIAEGRKRASKKEFAHFLSTALGSAAELETQLEIAKRLSFITKADYTEIDSLLLEVTKMLNKLISSLRSA